ncbi:MAG: hypothetical protein R3A52_17025 [Polyangiales bacterium]
MARRKRTRAEPWADAPLRLSEETLEERREVTEALLKQIPEQWPMLHVLNEELRLDPRARAVFSMLPVLRALHEALSPDPKALDAASAAGRERWRKLREAFVILGAYPTLDAPQRYDLDRLGDDLERIRHMQEIAAALDALAQRFRDDAMRTAAAMAHPAESALELARTLARSGFSSELARVTDALHARSASLRRKRAPKGEGEGKK